MNILGKTIWDIKSLNTREHDLSNELIDAKVDMCDSKNEKKWKGQTMLDKYLMIDTGLPKETSAKKDSQY